MIRGILASYPAPGDTSWQFNKSRPKMSHPSVYTACSPALTRRPSFTPKRPSKVFSRPNLNVYEQRKPNGVFASQPSDLNRKVTPVTRLVRQVQGYDAQDPPRR